MIEFPLFIQDNYKRPRVDPRDTETTRIGPVETGHLHIGETTKSTNNKVFLFPTTKLYVKS